MAGRGLFNKLVDTFNAVADDAKRQLVPKEGQASATTAGAAAADTQAGIDAGSEAGRAAAHPDSAQQMSADGGRQASPDGGHQAFADMARAVISGHSTTAAADSSVQCRFCKTTNPVGSACSGCGATPDR